MFKESVVWRNANFVFTIPILVSTLFVCADLGGNEGLIIQMAPLLARICFRRVLRAKDRDAPLCIMTHSFNLTHGLDAALALTKARDIDRHTLRERLDNSCWPSCRRTINAARRQSRGTDIGVRARAISARSLAPLYANVACRRSKCIPRFMRATGLTCPD